MTKLKSFVVTYDSSKPYIHSIYLFYNLPNVCVFILMCKTRGSLSHQMHGKRHFAFMRRGCQGYYSEAFVKGLVPMFHGGMAMMTNNRAKLNGVFLKHHCPSKHRPTMILNRHYESTNYTMFGFVLLSCGYMWDLGYGMILQPLKVFTTLSNPKLCILLCIYFALHIFSP